VRDGTLQCHEQKLDKDRIFFSAEAACICMDGLAAADSIIFYAPTTLYVPAKSINIVNDSQILLPSHSFIHSFVHTERNMVSLSKRNQELDETVQEPVRALPSRVESDSMPGELTIPPGTLWGAQTQRSLQNFPIGGMFYYCLLRSE
jgi:hypothetical protein